MEIYDVKLSNDERLAKPRRLLIFAICFMASITIVLMLDWLWPDQSVAFVSSRNREELELGRVSIWVLWSLVMSIYFSSKSFMLSVTQPWAAYQLIVEENQIRTRNFNSWEWALAKTIQRGSVRTLVEKEKGLLVSSRGRIGTFLWGGIWIPTRMTNYEYLKRVIVSWDTNELID